MAGMKKEMLSMKNFDVFDEVPTSSLSQEALSEAISTRRVKVRKSDGTVRCRIVAPTRSRLMTAMNFSLPHLP